MSDPRQVPSVRDEVQTLRVRRAPRYGVFLVVGAVLGALVALILTFSFSGNSDASPFTGARYSDLEVFGFVLLICVPIGLALGGAVALVLDRVVGRRGRDVRVDHESVHLPE